MGGKIFMKRLRKKTFLTLSELAPILGQSVSELRQVVKPEEKPGTEGIVTRTSYRLYLHEKHSMWSDKKVKSVVRAHFGQELRA